MGKSDKIVTSQKQAVAIALNQSGLSRKKKKRQDADEPPPQPLSVKQRVLITLKSIINSVYTGGVDAVLKYAMDSEGTISGLFRDGPEVYTYTISPSGQISYVEADKRRKDAYLEGYYLTEYVPLTGSVSPYTQGVLEAQINGSTTLTVNPERSRRVKFDKNPGKNKACSLGKPCGEACIAKGLECIRELGEKQRVAIGQVREALKDENNQRTVALAGLGLLGGAAIAAAALSRPGRQKTIEPEPRAKKKNSKTEDKDKDKKPASRKQEEKKKESKAKSQPQLEQAKTPPSKLLPPAREGTVPLNSVSPPSSGRSPSQQSASTSPNSRKALPLLPPAKTVPLLPPASSRQPTKSEENKRATQSEFPPTVPTSATDYKRPLVPRNQKLRGQINKAKREQTGLKKAQEDMERGQRLQENRHSPADMRRGIDQEMTARDRINAIKAKYPERSIQGNITVPGGPKYLLRCLDVKLNYRGYVYE